MSEQNNLDANKAMARRWFEEVWNKGRPEAITEMLADGAVVHGLSDDAANPLKGPEGFLPFHKQFRDAFPNIEVVVEDTIAEGDKVAVRCSVRGKHVGDSLGFEATGTTAEFDGIAIVRVKDGKFVEAWNNFDFARMYRQLEA
jgi:steroid delta-isomerase-like uncharacterized protein